MKLRLPLCVVLSLVTVCGWIAVRHVGGASHARVKTLAIVPFGLPTEDAERAWLGGGFPRVLALRLQHLPGLKTLVLPRPRQSMLQGLRPPLDSASVAPFLEQIRPGGYDFVLFGNFYQVENTLRVELQLWRARPHQPIGKLLEQSPEKDPDGLAIKLAGFVASVLQIPVSEPEGRLVGERYTSSAEAFERFARALILSETPSDEEDVSRAFKLLREATELDGKFSAALRQFADLSLRQGHYVSAADAYQSLLRSGKRGPHVYRLLGDAYFAQHDAKRAIDAYKRGLQVDSRDPQLHLGLGLAFAAQKEYENATKAFLRMLEVKSDDPLAFANLGVVYLLRGNFPAATVSLRRAQVLGGTDVRVAYNLGLALMFERAYDEAREQFEQALELKPDFPPAAYQLALLTEGFDSAQAIEGWRRYLRLAEGKPGEQLWVPHAQDHLKRLLGR